MKVNSNSNSILNKFGDVNTELIKLNKKIQLIESVNDKLENSLKEESLLRQNIEKKTFHMNETFNNKFGTMRKGFDDLVQVMTEQIEGMKAKITEDMKKNNSKFFEGFEDSLKRLENYEKKSGDVFTEFSTYKSENNSRFNQFEDLFQKELKEIKKEISGNNIKIEVLEKKINENIFTVQNDLGLLVKDVNSIKNEIEMVKNFKENTILNFKDISEEFVKNEEVFNKFTSKINVHLQEFESKLNLFEQSFTMHNESFVNIKKDIYAQIYDSNLNINNKFQMMNETIFEKLEGYDKSVNTFQNSLIDENDKFTSFISEQFDQHQKNLKKIIDFMNEDLDLLKNKVRL